MLVLRRAFWLTTSSKTPQKRTVLDTQPGVAINALKQAIYTERVNPPGDKDT